MVQVLSQLPSWLAKARFVLGMAFGALSALGTACSVAPVDYGTEADAGSTVHALVAVERTSVENTLDSPRAAAFAGFVRSPPDVDANAMLRLAGFGLDLPVVGQCAEPNRERPSSVRLRPLARVEFLDAGDVTLRTVTTSAPLATRALPAVTDLIAGVVYTTRDRETASLPAATNYTLSTSGAGTLPAFNVVAAAPLLLTAVSVGETPLGELSTVSARSAIQLSWSAGRSRDLVYVELTSQDGGASTRCTFRDDAGHGTIPAGVFAGTGSGELSVHRVHSEPFAASGSVDAGEVRFDFEQSANVEFSQY